MTQTVYSDSVLKIIENNAAGINEVATILGLDAVSIGAAIAEEVNDAHSTPIWSLFKNDLLDFLTKSKATHESILKNYNTIKSLPSDSPIVTKPGGGDKWDHPVLRDVGLGNIKISTAIDLLRAYDNPSRVSDPLSLTQYRNDYGLFV